jgi:hypothetical protein
MSHLRRSWLTLIFFVAIASWAQGATYFVKNGGSDAADGLSDAKPWSNISKVNSTAFSAGDTINFRRGSAWTGTTLVIDSNGSSRNPVTYQAYDTGNAPIIQFASSPPTSRFTHASQVIGDWNLARDFLTRNAHEACIRITATAANNVVRNAEATPCGLGIPGGATIGDTLSTGESSGSPSFVDAGNSDLHLQSTRTARDAGAALGYTLDHEKNLLPKGSAL